MNTEQLKQLRELLASFGYQFNSTEQTITKYDNTKDKGEFVITYQARFSYENKLKENE